MNYSLDSQESREYTLYNKLTLLKGMLVCPTPIATLFTKITLNQVKKERFTKIYES